MTPPDDRKEAARAALLDVHAIAGSVAMDDKEVIMSRVPRLRRWIGRWAGRLAGLADVLLAVSAAAPALANREVRPA